MDYPVIDIEGTGIRIRELIRERQLRALQVPFAELGVASMASHGCLLPVPGTII